ncbi:MAG: hypothetical protein NT040_16045 [Bacteroidetes bacterium]|nr:hypothetical protein [Bacteroidota bacterium]
MKILYLISLKILFAVAVLCCSGQDVSAASIALSQDIEISACSDIPANCFNADIDSYDDDQIHQVIERTSFIDAGSLLPAGQSRMNIPRFCHFFWQPPKKS